MPDKQWTAADVPGQRRRTAVITGANSGIGFQVAKVLAGRGASVVLACRDRAKSAAAADLIRAAVPDADLSTVQLNLADLASVRTAAEEIRERCDRIDLLINNAGLMIPPYQTTKDGFESQIGINHLGHFALTGLLLDRLRDVPGSRVVTVASNAHKRGRIDFDDLQSKQRYVPMTAYAQSKLANLLFTYELQRRLAAGGAETIAVAAHPGAARTGLTRTSPPFFRLVVSRPARPFFFWLIQDEDRGAIPILRAATDPSAQGGEYFGPGGWGEFTGRHAIPVASAPASHDDAVRGRLWTVSEQLTGVNYDLPATSAS